MGTNFYGYKYRSDSQAQATAVVAAEFLQLLQKYAPTLRWDAEQEEHYIAFKVSASAPDDPAAPPTTISVTALPLAWLSLLNTQRPGYQCRSGAPPQIFW
jgi:hypothetical protein